MKEEPPLTFTDNHGLKWVIETFFGYAEGDAIDVRLVPEVPT